MKSLVLCFAMIVSTAAFAQLNASEAFSKVLKSGSYEGSSYNGKCVVDLSITNESVLIKISEKDNFQYFSLLNSSNTYVSSSDKLEISATVTSHLPKYSNGGSKSLFVKENDNSTVEFFISEILLDHRGNDVSTYTTCIIEK